ncbi:serine hydrolase domain-containing protein [Evansella clarkii]|uniref:serine hydrolase domain-containing protein n=1 Tax=Evansella clarkii TaxID=79879 RepID=UPI00106488D6|nr:serine hydrolase [Evansella clarkii]
MLKTSKQLNELLAEAAREVDFSGTVLIKEKDEIVFQAAHGFANRAEKLENKLDTRFGIASGCKLFTAIGICQLVENGVVSFETKLADCLNVDFPHFDRDVTIHHLLTHTSGVPDYFDEAVMEDFADLWKEQPMYLLDSLAAFLPMFQKKEMLFSPGERFHYNNAAFILLGLVVEEKTGMPFSEYIVENIFKPAGMADSGYFSLDQLPENTALGYIDHEDGSWKTNVYSIPVKGGADGGAFTTSGDMLKLWKALLSFRLLKEDTTKLLLTPHAHVEEDDYYGYGVWIVKKDDDSIFKYHVMGYDPGVSFHSAYYPEADVTLVVSSNKSEGAWTINKAVQGVL